MVESIQMTGAVTTYAYDTQNRLLAVTHSGGVIYYNYDKKYQLISETQMDSQGEM
jgi:YD repeat-containing protein